MELRSTLFIFLLLFSALLATSLPGVAGEVNDGEPLEAQCRPYVEQALKKLETGDTPTVVDEKEDTSKEVDESRPTETEPEPQTEGEQASEEEKPTEDDATKDGSQEEATNLEDQSKEETETEEPEPTQAEDESSKEADKSAEETETSAEAGAVEESQEATEAEKLESEKSEEVKPEESGEQAEKAEESGEQADKPEESGEQADEAAASGEETSKQEGSEEEKTDGDSKEVVDEAKEESGEKASAEQDQASGEVQEDASAEKGDEAASKEAESEQKSQEVDDASAEKEGEQLEEDRSAEKTDDEQSTEQTEASKEEDGKSEEEMQADAGASAEKGDTSVEQEASAEQQDEADSKGESQEVKEETDGGSQEQKEEGSQEQTEEGSQEEASQEQKEVESQEQKEGESKEEVQEVDSKEQDEQSQEKTETSGEQTGASEEKADESGEQKGESGEQKEESGEKKDESGEKKEESGEEVAEGEKADTSAEEQKEEPKSEEGTEASKEEEAAVEETEAASSETDDAEKTNATSETLPEEDLMQAFDIPTNLRSRSHISQLLHLDDESNEVEKVIDKAAEGILKDLKRIYENAIKPLETLYKYRDLSNRHFGDPEIFSKPLVLFMGPWSGGKSSIINYLLDNEYKATSLRTGAEPSPAYFNILMWGEQPEMLDGTQLAADWTFSGLQKFGQGLEERLKGLKLPNKLLEKVNIVEIPGILEVRKQVSRVFPFNDACQWFIDRADIIFLVYDPSKLDVGPETEAILDQLKGREYQTRILLNKADQVKSEELMRVQGALIWNISPLMSSAQPPVMYLTSLWSRPYEEGAPVRLLQAQERAFLRDIKSAIDKRIENKISSARRFAVRVRNHAKMVDCYLTTYYNHKSVFANRKLVADQIIEHPQDYHIYEGLSTLTNISRYDLPDPDVYRDFFRLNPLYEFQQLAATCTYFRGCPINRLDIAIAYDFPELVGKYKKTVEAATASMKNSDNNS